MDNQLLDTTSTPELLLWVTLCQFAWVHEG